jgi:plastocyanin
MTASRACAAILSLALVGGFAGCGDDDEDGGGGATTTETTQPAQTDTTETGGGAASTDAVQIVEFKFKPAEIRVKRGTRLTWSNEDDAAHTATAEDRSFDTGAIAQGEEKAVTLSKTGEFAYICDFHPFMKGTVVVE